MSYASLEMMFAVLFGKNGWIFTAVLYFLSFYFFILVAGLPFYYNLEACTFVYLFMREL